MRCTAAIVAAMLAACTDAGDPGAAPPLRPRPAEPLEAPQRSALPPPACFGSSLTYAPVTLPAGVQGEPYEIEFGRDDLRYIGEHFRANPASPAPGLAFVVTPGFATRIRGVPTAVGSFRFQITAESVSTTCSIGPDDHTFDIAISAAGPRDGGADDGG